MLTSQQQEQLLVELLQDHGGVEPARAMLQRANHNSEDPDEPQQSSTLGQQQNIEWCKCRRCHYIDNLVEQVCCKMRSHVTTTGTFQNIVLNRHVLSVCIIDCGDYMGEDPTYTPASYQKAAYRQYIYIPMDIWEGATAKLCHPVCYGKCRNTILHQTMFTLDMISNTICIYA